MRIRSLIAALAVTATGGAAHLRQEECGRRSAVGGGGAPGGGGPPTPGAPPGAPPRAAASPGPNNALQPRGRPAAVRW
jgi:hypothetical protein